MKKLLPIALILLVGIACETGAQNSYTFTTCGASGQTGPSQLQATNTYSSTSLAGQVTVTAGYQYWTVPSTASSLRIECWGAQGGAGSSSQGGLGARMRGDFTVTPGTVLKILVGHQGIAGSNQGGGGGGTYVTFTNNTPLVIAGGGGGAYYGSNSALAAYMGGTIIANGNPGVHANSSAVYGAGGSNGSGGGTGTAHSGAQGAAGGGLLTNGANGNGGSGAYGGTAFVNGGNGGTNTGSPAGPGGFGGGGGSDWSNWTGGGGGGGYSGGGNGVYYGCGGGGGSFNAGANQSNTSATNSGHGKVVITELCSITLSTSISNTQNAICSGQSVTLTTNAVANYSWSTGATTSSIVITPTLTGTVSVTGQSSLSCTSAAIVTIQVANALPAITVTNTSASNGNGVCPNRTVALTASVTTSGPTTYSWSNSVVNGASFAPTSSNVYTITAENACGTSTAATSVSIHPTPTVQGSVSQATICSGNTATFVGTGTNVTGSYTWIAANGIHPTNGQAYFPTVTQNYTVYGMNAQTCTSSAVVSQTVVTTPLQPPFATPTLICNNGTSFSTITAVGASVYSWAPVGTFTGASTSSIVVSPTTTTTYTVTKSNANCVDTKTVTLVVNQLPFVFGVASPTVICASKPATLSVGGGISYTWATTPSVSLPSGPTANNIVVTPSVPMIYTVTAHDGTCTNTATVGLAVNPNPTITIAHTGTVICLNQCTSFSLSGADTYTWATVPAGTVPSGPTAVICPTTSTNYSISGTNSFACTSNKQQVVIVNPLPVISTTVTRPLVCSGAPSTLIASGSPAPVSYNWTTGSNLSSTIVNPLVSSSYVVTVTINNTGCKDTRTVNVNVFLPTFQVTPDTAICYGGNITLCASQANSYTWTSINPPSQFPCITVQPTVQTLYLVSASSTSNNVTCVSNNSVQVSIYNQPTVTATAEHTTICRGDAVNLIGGGAFTYTWTEPMGTLFGATVSVSPNNIITYTVWGTDQFGCKDTNYVTVRVSSCVGLDELSGETLFSVYPNPNAGTFIIKATQPARIRLYNELGQLVRTIEITQAGGFKAEVSDLAGGVYFINATDDDKPSGQKIIVNDR